MKMLAPLVSAALVLATSAAAATGSLPLRHGRYVDDGAGCAGAPSAASSWFGGGYVIQAPHAQCKLMAVVKANATHFRVTKRCYEHGDPTMPFTVIDDISVVGPREYVMINDFGRFQSHWCRS